MLSKVSYLKRCVVESSELVVAHRDRAERATYMNLVMSEVFPTLCSPKKTSLNLCAEDQPLPASRSFSSEAHFLRAA